MSYATGHLKGRGVAGNNLVQSIQTRPQPGLQFALSLAQRRYAFLVVKGLDITGQAFLDLHTPSRTAREALQSPESTQEAQMRSN